MRSVENGVAMARTASNGLLTLNDRYGRVISMRKTDDNFTTVTGDLPLDVRGGNTVYDRAGDLFGWLCAVFGFGLFAFSFVRRNPAS
jgi:apolipoprotein N-acyltransferase